MCKKPCKECPYRTDSLPGYFGGQNPAEYAAAIHMEIVVACHTRSKYTDGLASTVVPCTGHVLSQIKSCKSPNRNSELIALHNQVRQMPDKDVEAMSSNILESFKFREHHDISIEDVRDFIEGN